MHFNTISGRHGGVPYSGVEIRHRTHTLKEFLFIHFESSFHFDQELLKKADLGSTVLTLCLAIVRYRHSLIYAVNLGTRKKNRGSKNRVN